MNVIFKKLALKQACVVAALWSVAVSPVSAHEVTFDSSMTYSNAQPSGDTGRVANWTGAAFDAGNIGGSGVNADGGADNGVTNDMYTYVANNQPVQGQTFLTGSSVNGYQLNAITVRMAGYTSNNVTGSNGTSWNLNDQNGPIILTLCEINGTNRTVQTIQCFKAGDVGNPGSGSSANGPGTYITFHMPVTVDLDPNTTYGFELSIGNASANFFEWLGTGDTTAYTNGTAYHISGNTIIPTPGDHVFMADMSALASAPGGFSHPGTLHTQADFDRMKAKVAAGEEPWLSGYNVLISSPYAQTSWSPVPVTTIVRGGTDPQNYTRSQEDAQAIYDLALRWRVTGDTNYAERAVYIANAWSSTLQGVNGDSNAALGYGICGYLFAIAGDVLSTYPGWAPADKEAYKDMMMRVFYPANYNFLWWHYDTFWREGGNTHYRLNWDVDNMASMEAIGILCDNRAVYEQAVDYFKHGCGNGNVRRAVWYLHPGGLGQGEEAGRDQGHNMGGWYTMSLLCQMAWNQGDDLFGYDNNRVLRAFEYNAKYNLGHDVPYARHRNSSLTYTEGSVSSAGRGIAQYYQYELVYNHYQNVMGIAAPWSRQVAAAVRPEPWPNTSIHPSQVDWFGLGTLTFSQDATTNDVAPSGLRANWSKDQIILDWWGSARATGYLVKRATAEVGPYQQIGTVTGSDLNFTDTNVVNGTTYYYTVSAETPSGNLDSSPLRVSQELVSHYTFEGSATNSVSGGGAAALHGGSTGLPGYAAGFGGGQAISLDGVDDYVQLPVDSANHQDITVSAWVYWNGGNAWQRIFDFGSEMENTLFLTPYNGSQMELGFTTTRGGNVVGDASYYLSAPTLPVHTWTHVAVTLKGDALTLYVNGVPVDSTSDDLIDPLYGQPFCYIGKSMYNADPLFSGRIDDFRIYNHALSGAEVYNLWGQSSGNHAPVFPSDPISFSATEDSAFNQALSATDLDGGTLTYSKVTGPGWLSVASDGALSGTPSNSDVGRDYAVVRVADPSGATDDATLWINVANVNDPPTWNMNPIDGGFVASGAHYSFSVATNASDVDVGDSLSFSKVSGPAWLAVATNGVLSGTPAYSDAGTNTFTLRVTDLAGAYADTVLQVDVLPGDATEAYWNFEEGTADAYVAGPAVNGAYVGSIVDVSGHGNHLSPWSGSTFYYRTNSAAFMVPQTGVTNTLSIQNAGSYPSATTVGTPINTWNPKAWTIEAAIRPDAVSGFKTMVGRDSYGAYSPDPSLSVLYFSMRDSKLAVQFTDNAGNNWNLESSSGAIIAGHWQAVVATSDGSTLKLYVKDITVGASSYTLLTSSDISASADPALAIGVGSGSDWTAGEFSVGRGLYNGGHVDRFFGYLDDVRLSDAALTPDQFLYSTPLAPAAPSGLSAVSGDAQVALSWNAVANASGYNVKRSLTSGGGYDIVGSPAGTGLVDTGLTNGMTYYYVLSTVGVGGEGTNSLEVSAVPSIAVAPNEYVFAGQSLSGGTNLSLAVSNSVPGHLYGILATDSLTPPVWTNILLESGNGSNLSFDIPISSVVSNRYFKLNVTRE